MSDFFKNQKQTDILGLNLLGKTNCRDIHLATLRVLEQTGVFVEDQKAQEVFINCGARADKTSNIVKLPSRIVEDAIQSAPPQVRLAGRKADLDILLEDNKNAYLNFGGNINLIDPDTGMVRNSTKADVAATARLCDALNEVNVYSRAVYALDQTPKLLHLHTAEACFNNTAKHCFHGPESQWEVEKIIEMATATVGGAENLKTRKPITFVAAASSPLKLTQKSCAVIMASAGAGFSTKIASMAMAGGTAPVNLAGALVQTNAEILAGIVLAQLIRKGTPVIYSSYSTGLDLRLGTSPLGSPETALIAGAVAGLCRYYQIPCLVPGLTSDSKRPGIQAAFEKTMTGVSAAMAGANLIVGIGGLESGLTFDFGQAVLDAEIVRMIKHLKQGIEVNEDTLSVDLIHEIGPFGEFLSHDTTLLKMKSLSRTQLFDRTNREDWVKTGRPQSYTKALSRANDILENHKPEPLPPEAVKHIRAIVDAAEKEVSLK